MEGKKDNWMTQQNLVVGNEWTIEKQVRASDHFLIHTHLTPKCDSKQICSGRKVLSKMYGFSNPKFLSNTRYWLML